MFKGIAHMAFVVSDMEKSLKFYRDILGFAQIYALDDDAGKPWLIYLRVCNGTYIELFYGGKRTFQPTHETAGFMHICLECDDIYQTVRDLESQGVKIDVQPNQGKDFNYQAWISDPDGNKIELMTIDKNSPQAKA